MSDPKHPISESPAASASSAAAPATDGSDETTASPAPTKPRLDPTRYGDWELAGKCVDF
jgi:hypothetical protein